MSSPFFLFLIERLPGYLFSILLYLYWIIRNSGVSGIKKRFQMALFISLTRKGFYPIYFLNSLGLYWTAYLPSISFSSSLKSSERKRCSSSNTNDHDNRPEDMWTYVSGLLLYFLIDLFRQWFMTKCKILTQNILAGHSASHLMPKQKKLIPFIQYK